MTERSCEMEITVKGRGPFPVDMLRRDECWPVGTDDAAAIVSDNREEVSVRLRSRRFRSWAEPNEARWASFGWRVVHYHLE